MELPGPDLDNMLRRDPRGHARKNRAGSSRNPLIIKQMVEHIPGAGSYVPIRTPHL
jgi:hypothetical protein